MVLDGVLSLLVSMCILPLSNCCAVEIVKSCQCGVFALGLNLCSLA